MKPDLSTLQEYVDSNLELRQAIGADADEPVRLRPLAQGEYNLNFAFEAGRGPRRHGFVLRVNLGSQMHLKHQIAYEMGALRLLEPSGRTPKGWYVDDSREQVPWGVGVEDLLGGRPLRYQTDMPVAAAILADIHALPAPPGIPEDAASEVAGAQTGLVAPARPLAAIVDECDHMYAVYKSWAQADANVVRRIDRLQHAAHKIVEGDGPATSRHIVNTELNSNNFLVVDVDGVPSVTESHLIDWEKPVIGEVEQDLGHFLVPTTTHWKTETILSAADVDRFVDLYVQAVNGRFPCDGIRERLDDYLTITCLRGVTWCAMAYTEYAGADERALRNADTFQRIQEFLSPEFLDMIAREYYHLG